MKRYISDLHFCGEECITNFDRRSFANAQEMDKYMIKQWNATIKGGDTVIVLGDMFATKDANKINSILNKLNGKFCLITGNHDVEWMKVEGVNLDKFEWIRSYSELNDGKKMVIVSHYPIFCYNHQHLKDSNGANRAYMLYGHVHNSAEATLVENLQNTVRNTKTINKNGIEANIPSQMINCFCMKSDYKPLTLDEWVDLEKKNNNWPY
jgi:calcineurin-like phosphoesterase family protein